MDIFKTDNDSLIEAILFVVNRVDGIDKHKLSKILYSADKKHLDKYGRTVTGDKYVKMDYGPVPSKVYDFIKVNVEFPFHTKGNRVISERKENIEELSESDISCLNEAIRELGDKDFSELVDLSHDESWDKGEDNKPYSLDTFLETFEDKEVIREHIEVWD